MIDAISCMRLPFRIPDTALNEADKATALSEQIVVFTWELSIRFPPAPPIDLSWILFYFGAGSPYSAQAALELGSAPAVDRMC